MRLVLYGNFVVNYCSEFQYALELEQLGHEVIRLQETDITSDRVLDESLKSDALIWVHSHGFINQGRPMQEVLSELKKANVPTIAYHLDLYMGLDRWKDYENSPYMQVEYFFTVDKLMMQWFRDNTEVKAFYMPAGVFSQEAYLAESSEHRFANDVLFVGSKGYHHEWPYRPKLVDWLANNYKERFSHVGGDGLGVVRGPELNRLYAGSKIAIGDTLCLNFDYPYYYSDRVFESLGRGAFLIHPYIQGMEEIFEDKKHLVFYEYNNFDQLRFLIEYYLYNKDEREMIRLAGHELVKKEHTYLNRWQDILSIVTKDKNEV